jgi:hypothetical protein
MIVAEHSFIANNKWYPSVTSTQNAKMIKWGFRKNSQGVHHGNQQRMLDAIIHLHFKAFQINVWFKPVASGKPI